jgi:sterol desaturase/sphingolipid hydroxylase (fatty acid hydroxylase superfamily)
MHVPRGRGLPSAEHLEHHADVTYFSPASKKALSTAATTAIAYPVAARLVGPARGAAFTAGLVTTYLAYEVAHRRTHTHAPTNHYARWARRNHLRHHFGAPMRNFGVTVPLWDRVFGTHDDAGTVITVPRRMAPTWLLDEQGAVRTEFAVDYRVAEPSRARPVGEDRERAFANVAPDA